MHLYVHCSIIYNSQLMEAARRPLINEQIKKMWYTQWNITQPLERTNNLPFASTWMELESIMLSEVGQ